VTLPNRIVRGGKGAGLVTTRAVAPGEVVAEFTGEIVRLDEVEEAEMPYVLWLGGERWMIPRSSGRYINHGCDPNCTVEDRADDPDGFDVVASRPIEAGEEITFAYNLIEAAEWAAHRNDPAYRFWHPSWSFACLCGAPRCQGRIEGYRIVDDVTAARER
jgi:SET domain-containing protein